MIGMLIGGRYRLQHQIGSGGMGTVYAAQDERLQRQIALKLLRPEVTVDPQARRRLISEGQIAAQVVHPNIVRTYDAGDDPAGPFLVQELLAGEPLDQRLPLSSEQAMTVLDGMAAALGALHEQGFVHCDVKPQNIWLRPDGTPVLLDFGIARVAGTAVTTLIATPQYLAPERFDGLPPTPASDWYALGMVAYQLVMGKPPFDQPNMHEVIEAQRTQPVPSLPPSLPFATGLDAIIRQLTAKPPTERYADAAIVRRDLAALQQGQAPSAVRHDQPTLVVVPSGQPAEPPPVRREPQTEPSRRPDLRRLAWVLIPLAVIGMLLAAMQARRNTAAAPQPTVEIAPATLNLTPNPSPAVPTAVLPTVPAVPATSNEPPVAQPANAPNEKDKDKDNGKPKDNGNDKDTEKGKAKK